MRSLMATMLNTVAKETITPLKVMQLPFIDTDISATIMPIRNDSEAFLVLREVRGF